MKNLIIFALALVTITCSHAQSLSEQLWAMANPCVEDVNSYGVDGEGFEEKIDDSKNGYLKITGAWPACGCGCEVTAGAYRRANGNYSILARQSWNCTWTYQLSSNVAISNMMPEGFGARSFIPSYEKQEGENLAFFFLDIDIPRIGTATKVEIKLIPLGIKSPSENAIGYGYGEGEGYSKIKYLNAIQDMARDFQNEKSLEYILEGNFNALPGADKKMVDGSIGGGFEQFANRAELILTLRALKRAYELYNAIEYKSLTLDWSVEKGRFYVKSKGKPVDKISSFRAFLKEAPFWGPVC